MIRQGLGWFKGKGLIVIVDLYDFIIVVKRKNLLFWFSLVNRNKISLQGGSLYGALMYLTAPLKAPHGGARTFSTWAPLCSTSIEASGSSPPTRMERTLVEMTVRWRSGVWLRLKWRNLLVKW